MLGDVPVEPLELLFELPDALVALGVWVAEVDDALEPVELLLVFAAPAPLCPPMLDTVPCPFTTTP